MVDQSLIGAVERYYTTKVETHGATPRGVDWNGEESQRRRFEQLLRVISDVDGHLSINDFGCGYGSLLDSLEMPDLSYCGYDVSEAMIAAARSTHSGDSRASFVSDEQQLQSADFTIASGIFNVRLEQPADLWREYVLETIDKLAAISRHGMAFNALTSHADADRMRPDLYYADPAVLLDYCLRRHSRDISLHHDYELYEFTIIVRLDGRPPAKQSRRGPGNE
ncbi:MAG TPA: class I SAM-dependent methyltransferase [Solirubrobacteraceae bacterium]|jgi:SAM-dependent methyltransferase|nr:class I SAM-dependent methyltransferase [Solirubrobacteraceae bacterium]